jgi:hypothetical protein
VTGRVRVQEFRLLRRNSLRRFATVQFHSGLIVAENAIHVLGSRVWAAPPSRPMIDRDGAELRDEEGKIRYVPVISFQTHGVRSSWSRQIIAAEAHLEAFA